MARQPLEPFGAGTGPPPTPFQVLPAGPRPYYCFAVAGLARDRQTYLPPGLDYCALAKPLLITSREDGVSTYAPFHAPRTQALGIQTPIYRRGATPTTVAGRRRAFVGWLGELIVPQVVIDRALAGHPNTAVVFSYRSAGQHVTFSAGRAPHGSQRSLVDLHNGWIVESQGSPVHSGILADDNALTVLVGGSGMSVLVGLLVVLLGTGRMRALSLVREKTRELSHQALHDSLTGLPNRALVLDRAEQMLARVARQPGVCAGALFVDVDGFKHVNDKLGHAAGDELLGVIGQRLQSVVRGEDTVGRLGGDEFVVLVEAPTGGTSLDQLANRLIDVLRQPVELGDGRKIFAVTASVGIATGRYRNPDDLLRDADLALYAAKAEGRDRYVLFDPKLYEDAEVRLQLEVDLGVALQEEQFFLLYQPIFDLPHQRVVSVEALLRWRHPERGVVPPALFIPLAEESGLIVPIGRWVLREACRQVVYWNVDGRRLGVSVNVSAHQLGRGAFIDDVREALSAAHLHPSLLTLEITETTLMREVAGADERLREIKELGVGVAIDDFGTGYASLSNLQRMPVDVLKVDRSFIAALNDDDRRPAKELLEAIIGVGQALSLRVVAEGIEVPSQMAALEEMGCEMAQGFLMGRPSPAEAIAELLVAPAGVSTPAG
jgi:diguanylate cyclase (GGDEF)-like protein